MHCFHVYICRLPNNVYTKVCICALDLVWRKEEVERINEMYAGAERKAALCALLEQETQLISSIGRHKIDAGEENQQKAIQDLLNKVRISTQ